MTGRTHDLAAMVSLLGVTLTQPTRIMTLSTLLLSVLANQIGGIAPDLDQPTAPFWRNLPIGNFFGKIFGGVSGGHRFITHSILGLVLFGFGVKIGLHFISPLLPHADMGLVLWAFMIGMVSHLIMDSFTKEGVPWLLPIPIKFGIPPIKHLRITTGKKFESLILFPGLVAVGVWICAQQYPQLLTLLHNVKY